MKVEFCKYEGAGNDFIMIDNRKGNFMPESEAINRLCDRHFGIGGDGLILLENDLHHDFSMRYFNADGNEGTMCGNGGRCIAWYARNSGFDKNKFVFRASDGIHEAEILEANDTQSLVKLRMNDVSEINKNGLNMMVNTGSPHLLVQVKNIDNIDVYNLGRKFRYNEAFGDDGINVNFMKITDGEINLRTYERGVENETLACGTGAVASAVVALFMDCRLTSPIKIKAKGGRLKVFAKRKNDGFTEIWLEGPAKFVFRGEITVDVSQ